MGTVINISSMETHAQQELKTLGFQVQTLRKILDHVIESSFDQILSYKPTTFKAEVDTVLSELKHPEIPEDWYGIYRQKILSRVLAFLSTFNGFRFYYYENTSNNFLVIFNTCIGLFEDESAEQLELLKFLFDFLEMSSCYLGKYKELQKLIKETINNSFANYTELKLEIFKKYSENSKWNSSDSISGILITHFMNAFEKGDTDPSLENRFLKLILEKTNIFTKSGMTDPGEIKQMQYSTLGLLFKSDYEMIEKFIDDNFNLTDNDSSSFNFMLEFGILLIEKCEIQHEQNKNSFAP